MHEIEAISFGRIASEVDFGGLDRESREVAARIVHATGDPQIVSDLVVDQRAIARALTILARGGPVIADVRMVAVALTIPEVSVALEHATEGSGTRSSRGMQALLEALGDAPALVVIGSAPTALRALLAHERLHPESAVVAFPVGFVDAAESKAALLASGRPAITNRSRRGGSAMAAAAVNALALMARGEYRLG
jgi:precorrin isomerase